MNKEFELVRRSQEKLAEDAKKNAAVKKLTPREELLAFRITPETKLEPLEFLFKMNGTECFPLSELVANTGKAKSGKTLFLSIVMACSLRQNVLGLERISDKPVRVLWYDTEQSAQSTQQILVKRIMPLAESHTDDTDGTDSSAIKIDDQFFVFNVRGIGWQKRRELLAVAIETFKPDLVIVDGTKDLILDINDGTQATVVIEEQMNMAQLHHCCIVDVLHQNKSDSDRNMRGWIGTELTNKAFEVWSCSKVPNTETFKVEHVMSRMKRCDENLYYQLNENGLPVVCDKPDEQPRELNGRFASKNKEGDDDKGGKPVYMLDWSTLCRDYFLPSGKELKEMPDDPKDIPWDYVKLFTDAMEGYCFKRYNQLMAVVMRMANINDKPYYYHMLEVAQQQHILVPGKDGYEKKGFYLNSPEQRQRILEYEAQQRRQQQEAEQIAIPFNETDEPVPF